ncbi:MAG: hypothetical protein H7336_15400 [Bacteriovorax sp.]|nr:hypothetical protein [Bacteriovorax sp.]
MILEFITFLVLKSAFAENRTSLFKKEEPVLLPVKSKKLTASATITAPENVNSATQGNLPAEYRSNFTVSIEESPIVVPSGKTGVRFRELKVGDLANATIQESVFAFQDSKAPVRALITTGALRGAVFIGEASLEKNSKRILIEFKKFRDPLSKDTYALNASAMDYKGILGIKGTVISNEELFFAAEFLAAGSAGYADSMISREQNAYGNTVENKTSDTLAKKALVAGLSKTADRFSEKLKQAPEYAVLEGPIQIQILILDQPTLTN